MSTTSSRFALTCLLTALLAAAALAAAQSEYIETGFVAATIDGVGQTTHAYDIVATDEDGTRRIPGATYVFVDEMKMGEMVLVEASYYVTILTYDMELLRPQDGSIELKFNLDPETLELSQPEETRVIYHPEGLNPDLYYVLTQGELKLDSVTVLDDETWLISGTIQGLMSRQDSYYPEHNPDEYFTIDARFEFQRVADYGPFMGL